MTSVMIVDDHPAFVAAARRLLESAGFRVVGEAFDGRSAIALAAETRPDVVLLDIQLPDIDGFAVARELNRLDPQPVVVLTSTRDGAAYRAQLERTSARGFVPKADLSAARLAAMLP